MSIDEPPEEKPIKRNDFNDATEKVSMEKSSVDDKSNFQLKTADNLSKCQQVFEADKDSQNDDSFKVGKKIESINESDCPMNNKKRNFPVDNKKVNVHSKKFKQSHASIGDGRLKFLNRLLARSIQHERNIICQCITFIANNNYFD